MTNNTCTLRITAAAGTKLAGAYLSNTVIIVFDNRALTIVVLTHAILLDQAFAHCPRFPTAASLKSLGRVSVPV